MYDAWWSISDELQGVWKCDETISRVFDITSQSKLQVRRKQCYKILKKSMLLKITYLNHHLSFDFLCFNLMFYLMSLRSTFLTRATYFPLLREPFLMAFMNMSASSASVLPGNASS